MTMNQNFTEATEGLALTLAELASDLGADDVAAIVTTPTNLEGATRGLLAIAKAKRVADDRLGGAIADANRIHKELTAKRKSLLGPVEDLEVKLRGQVEAYIAADESVPLPEGVSYRKALAWEIEDEASLPRAFMKLVPDTDAIEQKVRVSGGLAKIKGVRVYDKYTVVVAKKERT